VPSGETPTYGESFTAAAGFDVLNAMTFEIQNTSGASIPFNAYVYAWNGTAITGSALFTSGPNSVASGAGFQAISVNTGAVALTDGSTYIALYSTLGDGGSASAVSSWGILSSDSAYPGGTFEYSNAALLSGLSDSTTWNNGSAGSVGEDLAFELDFNGSATPEPSTFTLIAGALVGAVLWRRRAARS
jgi:hypothetical protein